jgi:predicted ribosomally synthesized peptide with nif11-like leader
MSIAHARKFVQKLHTDPHLRNTVHFDRDHIVKVAKKEGYRVTPAEVRQAITEHWDRHDPDHPASGVLSEAPGF